MKKRPVILAARAQVYSSYGEKDNDELLSLYGFVDEVLNLICKHL